MTSNIILVLLFCGTVQAADGPYPIKVLRVIDGDTLEIEAKLWPGLTMRALLRLDGIDAPELNGKPCEVVAAKQATNFVRAWVKARENYDFKLVLTNKDKYGRALGKLHADDKDLGEEIIKAGHAKLYFGGTKVPWC